MVLPRGGRALIALVLLVAGWALLVAVGAIQETGLLCLAPALLLCVPLLLGRYVGEERLATLARRAPARRRRRLAPAARPLARVPLMLRGGRLVAASLAKRPPPAVGAVLA